MEELYVLQDARSYPDGKKLFWALDNRGYTIELAKAQTYTKSVLDAMQLRDTDIPLKLSELLPMTTKAAPLADYVEAALQHLENELSGQFEEDTGEQAGNVVRAHIAALEAEKETLARHLRFYHRWSTREMRNCTPAEYYSVLRAYPVEDCPVLTTALAQTGGEHV
jgi:hypothetical protein